MSLLLGGVEIPGFSGPLNISVPGFSNVSVPYAPPIPQGPATSPASGGSLLPFKPLSVTPITPGQPGSLGNPVSPVYSGSAWQDFLTNFFNPIVGTASAAATNPGQFVATGMAGDAAAVSNAAGGQVQHYAILAGAGLVMLIGVLGLVLPSGGSTPIPVPV